VVTYSKEEIFKVPGKFRGKVPGTQYLIKKGERESSKIIKYCVPVIFVYDFEQNL